MIKSKRLIGAGFLLTLTFIPNVLADEAQLGEMVGKLQKQMNQMQVSMVQQQNLIDQQNEKIRDLERRGPQIQAAALAPGQEATVTPPMSDYEFNERLGTALGGSNKWLKDLSFKGDLRLRYEGFHYNSGSLSETDDRNRFRYRLRFGLEKKFSDDLKVGFALASGETSSGLNVDPTSTNTTFDNNFNFKPIFIERAYATYYPPFLRFGNLIKKTEITAGKATNPFEQGSSDIVWDRDVKPEGVYEKVDIGLIKSDNFNLNGYFTAGQFVLDEDSTVGGDANLFAYQLGLNPVVYTPFFERPVDILSAVSYYSFNNYAQKSNFIIGGTSLARGNSNVTNPTELDAGEFEIIDVYNELSIYPYGLPVRFYVDYARNGEDHALSAGLLHEDNAWAMGVKLGGLNKKGDWEVLYQYKYIGANALVGAFNDSDFGDGHAGKRGNVIKLGYALTDTVSINGAMFLVENLNSGSAGILDQQQRRFQVDLNWKF